MLNIDRSEPPRPILDGNLCIWGLKSNKAEFVSSGTGWHDFYVQVEKEIIYPIIDVIRGQ
jgi:hypothetical protein